MADVKVLEEVPSSPRAGEWTLCFQWAEWQYEDDEPERGYRFIWRDKENSLRPQRGQARIPSTARMFGLIQEAAGEGWLVSAE